jgi:hypothetical protein
MKTKSLTTSALTVLTTASLLLNARADITSGLVGYWTFDDGSGSTAADSTANANNGTLVNFSDATYTSMWTTNAWLNKALLFNQSGEGTDTYVSVNDSSSIESMTTAKQWTLSAWVKPSVAGGSQTANAGIISKGNLNLESFSLYMSGGKFATIFHNAAGSGTESVSGTTTPAANTWYHVVATVLEPKGNATAEAIVWVNGVRESGANANTYTTVYSSTLPTVIGCRADASGNFTLPFQGTIDEVRIYSRALSTNDVFQLYTNNAVAPIIATQPRNVTCYSNDTAAFSVALNPVRSLVASYQWQLNGTPISGATSSTLTLANVTNGNAGTYTVVVTNYMGSILSSNAVLTVQSLPAPNTTAGLVGWWKFDDGSGSGTASDSSGNGDTGTLAGFTDTSYTSQWGPGIIAGALTFNGDGSGLNVVAIPNVGTPAPAVLDFSASPVFSLAAWVNGSTTQTNGGGIIAKGTGGGGEQYTIDIAGGKYRFFVRDTNGVAYTAQSAVAPSGFWQHVAGVLNATNGTMNLYVNGALAASGLAPSSVQTNSHEMTIGNRQPSTAAYGDAFTGTLDDVRVYGRDLTSADVFALYAASAFPIITAQTPVTYGNPFTLYAGTSPTFKLVTVTGLTPFSYQWYSNGVAIAQATNTSLTLTNVRAGSLTNYCIVTNALGSATSFVWTASVLATPTQPYPRAVLADNPIGYWRLNEQPDNGSGNSGIVANEYLYGNVGIYSNTVLAQTGYSQGLATQYGYSPASDPTVTSAQFGNYPFSGSLDTLVGGIQGITFATPTNTSAAFSIEAWVNGSPGQPNGGGMVTKGYGNGGEQFDLDNGSGTGHDFRFFFRDVGGTTHGASLSVGPDGNWHHLVGVVDEYHSNVVLYVDGAVGGTGSCSPSNGVLSSSLPVTIGGRTSSSTSDYNLTLLGNMNDVAIYNYPLSSNQVMTHYLAAGFPPTITQQPVSSVTVNEGATLIVAAQGGGGTPPVGYQWYDVTSGTPGTVVPGQTNATLVISNISAVLYNGHSLALSVTNAYGQPYSSSVFVTVLVGPPSGVTVNPPTAGVYVGRPMTFNVTAQGDQPFSYQWSVDGTPVAGATSSLYTNFALAGAHTIGCTVTNSGGIGSPAPATATLTGQTLPTDNYAVTILNDQPLAYWRLDEPLYAPIANDYVGSHNGSYNNAVNGVPGFSPSDPDTATCFGTNGVANDSLVLETDNSSQGIPNIDFSTLGTNAQLSVEAWIKAPPGQIAGAGIVTKGYGHAEQFDLDVYGDDFRFFVRDTSGAVHGPTSTFRLDNNWHHVVGVCDMLNGVVNLYVDGALQAATTNAPGLGIYGPQPAVSPVLTSIGSRMATSNDTSFTLQLTNAVLDEVALYKYALSSNIVAAHYVAGAQPPLLLSDLEPQVYAYVGFPLSLSVLATSSTPMTYQWQRNGTNLTDGGTLSGAHTNTLNLSAAAFSDAASYQLFITNQNTSIPAASTVAAVTVLPRLEFNGFGGGWSTNASTNTIGKYTAANQLLLTDGSKSESSSSYFSWPVYVGGFLATFTYQDVGGAGADGMAFVVQNDSRGPTVLGGGGGGFGYNGVTNSAALEFNIYANNGVGFAVRTNGLTGKPYDSAAPVNLASGDPINVTLVYENGALSITMTDAVAQASFATNVDLDIPAAVGGTTAYVGFSGGDGSVASTQQVSDFTFVSLPVLAIQPANNQIVITWPASVGGYALQQSPAVSPASWTSVSAVVTNVGGFNQVTLPAPVNRSFYRLVNSP